MENSTQDRLGEIVELDSQKWKIVADDKHSGALKKRWDYILKNVETGEEKRIFAKHLSTS